MSNQITFTGTAAAWRTSRWVTIDELAEFAAQGETNKAASILSYTSNDMSNCEGWVQVGTAQITVTLFERDAIVAKEVEGLNTQLQKVRAENQQRENAILDRISKLQALEWTA
jgi:hypothetical protein